MAWCYLLATMRRSHWQKTSQKDYWKLEAKEKKFKSWTQKQNFINQQTPFALGRFLWRRWTSWPKNSTWRLRNILIRTVLLTRQITALRSSWHNYQLIAWKIPFSNELSALNNTLHLRTFRYVVFWRNTQTRKFLRFTRTPIYRLRPIQRQNLCSTRWLGITAINYWLYLDSKE